MPLKSFGNIQYAALAAFLGLGLGESAWALSACQPAFAWPEWGRAGFWLAGALAGILWALAQGLAWRMAFSWEISPALCLGALSLIPCALGWLWPLVQKFPLPSPHDFPLRKLEILLAGQGILSLGLGGCLGLFRVWSRDSLKFLSPRSAALRLAGLSLVVYFFTGAWTASFNLTGDSPHYLLLSHSLAYDRDFDLANNFKRKDYLNFYDRELKPQDPAQADGRQVSEHKPLLPLLLMPGYRALGLRGALWTLALLAASGGGLFYLICVALGFSRKLCLLGWALFCFSAPWWVHSQMVLTEMPGGLLFLCALAAWQGLLPAWAAFVACGLTAWLNIHFYPVALALCLMTACLERKKGLARALAPVLLVGLSFGLSLVFNRFMFGSLNPQESYQQRGLGWSEVIKPGLMIRHLSGLMLDQEYGWFPFVPATALAFFGAWSYWFKDRQVLAQLLLPILVYLGPLVCFPWWYSAMAPNRYLICLMPAVTILTLQAWRQWGDLNLFKVLAALSVGWGLLMAVVPWFSWAKANGSNWLLVILGRLVGADLAPWFPSFMLERRISYLWVLAFAVALVLAGRRLGKPEGPYES